MLRATSDCARQAPKVADHHPSKCFGFGVYNAPWHHPSIACINHISYSSGKMGSSSKPFDIYEGPDSDLEMMKTRATKADLPLKRTRMKTKAHGKRGPPQVGEGTKSEHKARPRRKPKQSKLENQLKGAELAKPKRLVRLDKKQSKLKNKLKGAKLTKPRRLARLDKKQKTS